MLEDQSMEEGNHKLELREEFIFWMIGRIIGRFLLWITTSTRIRVCT